MTMKRRWIIRTVQNSTVPTTKSLRFFMGFLDFLGPVLTPGLFNNVYSKQMFNNV